MLAALKQSLGRSDLFAFNLRNRDAWVAAQAASRTPTRASAQALVPAP